MDSTLLRRFRSARADERASLQAADVNKFVDDLKQVMAGLQKLQTAALDRADALSALNDESVRAFQEMHHARQVAATVAQRSFENIEGLPPSPVPFQVEIPRWNEGEN